MARIAVISDTHGDWRELARARDGLGQVDWLLHAGDHLQDAAPIAEALGVDPIRVRAVVGNCDYPVAEPALELVEIEGVRILLTHGHQFGVKSAVDRLYYKAQEAGVRIAVFGHSHIAVNHDDGRVLLFNPGSLSAPRLPQDPPSCGLIEIAQGHVQATHLFMRKNGRAVRN